MLAAPAKLGADGCATRSRPRGYAPGDGPQQESSDEIVYLVYGLEPAFDMREPALNPDEPMRLICGQVPWLRQSGRREGAEARPRQGPE